MTRADLLEAWHQYLSQGRRRSAHTVRAYVATAARLIDAENLTSWGAVARLDASALRQQLAKRRVQGLTNASAARDDVKCSNNGTGVAIKVGANVDPEDPAHCAALDKYRISVDDVLQTLDHACRADVAPVAGNARQYHLAIFGVWQN